MPQQEYTEEEKKDTIYVVFLVLTIIFLIVGIVFKYLEIHYLYEVF